jgi:hypothetical protein
LLDNATITIAVIENKLKNNNKYSSVINSPPLLHTQTLLTVIHPQNKEEAIMQISLITFKLYHIILLLQT